MKKVKYFIVSFIGFSMLWLSVKGQAINFIDIYLEPDTIQSGQFKNYEAYDLGYLMLYKKPKKAEKFIIVNRSTNVELYSFLNPDSKGYFTKPRFYKSAATGQPTIMLLDVSELYSYGVHVFLINEKEINHCGFLDYAADNFNFSSLSLYSRFELVDGKIIYTLDDMDYIDHVNEELIPGKDLKFEIRNNSVERIISQD